MSHIFWLKHSELCGLGQWGTGCLCSCHPQDPSQNYTSVESRELQLSYFSAIKANESYYAPAIKSNPVP